MIIVFLNDRQTGVVKILLRFEAGNSDKRKCQRFVRIGDRRGCHLWLIFRRAVMGGDEMIAINREHRNHFVSFLGSTLLHQRAAICGEGIDQRRWDAECFTLPFALDRGQTIKCFFALGFVRCEYNCCRNP
jgi:hypothetical protein